MVAGCDAGGGSVHHMPVLKECPGWSRGRGTVDVLVAATSSSNDNMSAFTGLARWWEPASAALCLYTGDMYHVESIV